MKAGLCHRAPVAHRRVLPAAPPRPGAFSLVECLVYIGVLAVILTLLAKTYYHADWNHRSLDRNAADILRTLRTGEQWRQDVRLASGPIEWGPAKDGQELSIPHTHGPVRYAFRKGGVWRQAGQATRWQEVLPHVLSSRMEKTDRRFVAAWRWEVELKSPQKIVRVRPLFTFEAAAKEGGR